MILSTTLPSIPGQNFYVLGVVLRSEHLTIIGGSDRACYNVINAIMKQAVEMGADAIVDVKIATISDGHFIVVSGTAVKLR